MKTGMIFCFAGPSGSGKTTLSDMLKKRSEGEISRLITVTTREPRLGEVNGIDYHFWSEEQFNQGIKDKLFFEHQVVHGKFYGTLKKTIRESILSSAQSVIILDVFGAINLKTQYPKDVINIFLTCTEKEELKRRIAERGTTPDDMEKRLNAVEFEILTYLEHPAKFDYLIVNDDIDVSYSALQNIKIHESIKRGSLFPLKK